jgi:uncharacterized protein (DUF1697 family)
MTVAQDPTTWVALLRGINVGRHKRIAMADLRALLVALGYDGVRTHLQSGNAVFTTQKGDEAELEQQIGERIAADLGFDVTIFVRSADDLAAIVDANPFLARGIDPEQLHVLFLSRTPTADDLAHLDPEAIAPDEFVLGDRMIYLRLPNGVMGSRVPDPPRGVNLSTTMRNWNTVTRLRDLASA